MRCPQCGHSNDRVLDTREQREGDSIRRRRECLNCKARFTTLETISRSFPLVIKKDGRREPFSRDKLLKGIQAACQKRPVGLAQMESLVDRLTSWIGNLGEREVLSRLIGERIMRELRGLDDVAYVRFASVYRTFRDIQEFLDTLNDGDGLGGQYRVCDRPPETDTEAETKTGTKTETDTGAVDKASLVAESSGSPINFSSERSADAASSERTRPADSFST
ncbi:MAG: transcriptional regulator NrdR [Bdellovibrio sp.]|nr:MAG: transcriptional regulator NrdR [Bdellovibrio sp.]